MKQKQLNRMKKTPIYLQPAIIIALIILCFYLWNQSLIQDSRIDTLTKNLFDIASYNRPSLKEHTGTQFKEDFYLNQLNNSTSIIIAMITIITGLGAFLTYNNIQNTFKQNKLELKDIQKANQDLFISFIVKSIDFNIKLICTYNIKNRSNQSTKNPDFFAINIHELLGETTKYISFFINNEDDYIIESKLRSLDTNIHNVNIALSHVLEILDIKDDAGKHQYSFSNSSKINISIRLTKLIEKHTIIINNNSFINSSAEVKIASTELGKLINKLHMQLLKLD